MSNSPVKFYCQPFNVIASSTKIFILFDNILLLGIFRAWVELRVNL